MILASTLPDGSISFLYYVIELINCHFASWVLLLVKDASNTQTSKTKQKKEANHGLKL